MKLKLSIFNLNVKWSNTFNWLFIITNLLILVSCKNFIDKNNGYDLAEEPEFGDRLIVEREDTSIYRNLGSDNEHKVLQKGVYLKYHYPDGKVDSVFSWGGGDVIGSCIVKYTNNESFFIVEQKSLDDVFGELRNVENQLLRSNKPSTILDMRLKLNECNCSKFWIVKIKTDDIYGPFNLNDFNEMRQKLGVPVDLILKDNENIY